jgi:RNA polymerase sigma-70 factor (ECF subfamily)
VGTVLAFNRGSSMKERPAELEDRQLVARALEGERWAEEALFRRHVQDVSRTAARVLGRDAEVDDVVQDAFVLAFSRLGALREGASFGGWLGRITLNLVRARLRSRRWWSWLGLDTDEEGLEGLASEGLDPERLTELRRIDAVLRRMDAEARMAWILRHVEGWRLEEIADGLGVSLATTKRRLAHAEKRVAARFHKERSDE